MSEAIQVPRLRFLEFNANYKKYSFKNIFNFSTGKNIKQREASPEFKIPCVRYGELYHMYNEVIYKIINKTDIDKSELLFSNGDEILLPSAGEDPLDIGSASALTISNVAIGRTINILRPLNKNIYSSIYVSYYINQKLRKKISTLAKGSSISNVYNSDLKKLEIKLPELQEQKKIASFLTAVDSKIELLQQKKEALETYKKGVLQQIFSQQLRFKDAYGNNYPDWEEKKFNNVFFNKGGTSLEQFFDDKGGYKVVSIGNYNIDGTYNDNGQKIILNDKTKTKLLDKDDLVMVLNDKTKTGDIIGSTILIPENNKYIYNQRSERLICNKEIILPKYAWVFLNTRDFRKSVFKASQGGTQIYINFSEVKKMQIPLPSIKEQTKIVNFLTAIDNKIQIVNTQIENTQQFKKGLLQQMFV